MGHTGKRGFGAVPVFAPRTVLMIGAVIALAFVATLGGLWHLAAREDHTVVARSTAIVENAIKLILEDLERTVSDYARTGGEYDTLYQKVEKRLSLEQNGTPNLLPQIGVDYLYVIAPDGSTIFALHNGVRTEQPIDEALPTVLPLIDRARQLASTDDPATDIVAGETAPVLVAAEPVSGPSTDPPKAGQPAVMLLGTALTNERLARLGSHLSIDHLHIGFETPTSDEAAAPLPSDSPDSGLTIHWHKENPGRKLFLSSLPWLGLGFVAVLTLIALIIHQAIASARVLRASEIRLDESESRFRDVAEAASDWIWETDADRHFTFLSERFETVTGYRNADMLGLRLDDILVPDGTEQSLWSTLFREGDRQPAIAARYRDASGNVRICRIAAKRVTGPDGATIGLRGTANDITEEVEAHQRARFLSLHDSATGLPNRVMLGQFIADLLAKMDTTNGFAVLYIDLDRFKPVNDAFGHAAGDHVLIEIARRLQALAGDGNMVARVGGDEFVTVLDGVTSAVKLETYCLRLVETVSAPIALPNDEVYVGASVGVAVAPLDAMTADELLRSADVALYEAKRAGRGTHRFFAAHMKQEALGRQVLESELRTALLNDEFVLYYQPRFDPRTLAITSVEALLRWNHPKRGLVDPNEFISLAEDTGLIVPIGAWAARTACRAARQWPGIVVAVNLSSVQFRRDDVVEMVRGALEASGLPPERLELELTESVILENNPTSREKLAALKALGLRLAMDDFGTGYSSLGYLHSYPFDRIKIDRRFMIGADGIRDRKALLEAMLSLGKALSMAITVEGIETAEQLALLREAPCDEVQGLYLSPPLPSAVLEVRLGTDSDAAGTRSVGNRP